MDAPVDNPLVPQALMYLEGRASPRASDVFVSISDLECENGLSSVNAILLCEILTYSLAVVGDDRPKMYTRSRNPVTYTYDRMLKLMDLNGSEGCNVFTVLLSKHRNSSLFDMYLESRGKCLCLRMLYLYSHFTI
jgi:hypothetical protein